MTNPPAQPHTVFLRAECSGQHFPYDKKKNPSKQKTPHFLGSQVGLLIHRVAGTLHSPEAESTWKEKCS